MRLSLKRTSLVQHVALAAMAAVLALAIGLAANGGSARATTSAGALTGEGGDVSTPIMDALLNADQSQLTPDIGSYTNVNLTNAISDFVGTAPGTFGADFIVSERPLATPEAATATANGRSVAYVPIAASPVALMTLVPKASWSGTTILPDEYCQHIDLSLTDLDAIYGSPTSTSWGGSDFACDTSGSSSTTTTSTAPSSTTTTTTTAGGASALDPLPIVPWFNATRRWKTPP